MPSHDRPKAQLDGGIRRALFAAVVGIVLALAVGVAVSSASNPPTASAAANLCVVKKQSPITGKVITVYKTKVVKGKRVFVLKKGKKVPQKASCAKTKLCVVTTRKKGKLVPVYLTRLIKKKVIRGGKVKTIKQRVFVYQIKNGKKVKVKKLGKCSAKKKKSTSAGIPVSIHLIDPSTAHLDFGAFQRDIPLTGDFKGFIVGKGFVLGQDNQIQLSSGKVNLAPTGIFIDDVCEGKVTPSIMTDGASFAELDQGTTGNTVTVAANSTVTGLLHLRIQVAIDLRNDDNGCDQPYITTGWTDFKVPLFVKGKISAGKGGLLTTLSIGETVLDDLSACLWPGDPTKPCGGYAIPFPAVFSSKITTAVKIGS